MRPTQILFIFLLFFQQIAWGQIQLPEVIGDQMVLQQKQPIPIWGKASPGEEVHVIFKKQDVHTRADEDGNWKLFLRPLKGSFEPETMVISGQNKIELKDILVGEVWFCSGQSNMQWEVQQSAGGKEAIAAANFPNIRLFNVSRDVAFKRKDGKLAEWKKCSPQTVPDFSGVGYFFGRELLKNLDVPIGLINASYGGSQAEAWTPREYLQSEDLRPCIDKEKIWEANRPQVKIDYAQSIKMWEKAARQAKEKGEKPPRRPRVPDALRDYRIAASIYNGMVKPVIPFAVKGVLWYQGESNEARAEQYELLLNTMIKSWRDAWNLSQLPFAIIQLPNFRSPNPQPEDKAWSRLRESQRQVALFDLYTDLITIIDLGEADDIHPTNKLDVGLRLCRWSLAKVYGKEKVLWKGPILRSSKTEKGKMILTFSNVGEGLQLCKGKKLKEFAISGENNEWQWAKAKIIGKNQVKVWSGKVKRPLYVRYAFNNNPHQANLADSDCLPAGPFRTDKFPGPTAGKR